jgi:hypothetical protein
MSSKVGKGDKLATKQPAFFNISHLAFQIAPYFTLVIAIIIFLIFIVIATESKYPKATKMTIKSIGGDF